MGRYYFKTCLVMIFLVIVLGSDYAKGEVVESKVSQIRGVAFTEVSLNDVFWAPRIETNRSVTIPYTFKKCEETGRTDNFKRASRVLAGDTTLTDRQVRGYSFDDTDCYKILEGASYGLAVKADADMDKYLDDLIALIASAQEPDGYLYTARTINPEKPHEWAGKERWVNERHLSHELYDSGHLYEAAVAHYRATGKKSLLNIATKNADLLCEVYGPGKRVDWPGHQIVEMGLVKLYLATGKEKYLDLAKFLLDSRGPGGGDYAQAEKKIKDQDEAVGHAVRATYMYSGIADVAALTGDLDYVKAIDRIWENVAGKKMYITGGIGSTGGGEAFGGNYELPNMSAYCETCAAIGNVYWNHRLFLLHGEAKYIDVMERTLYNGGLSGVSLDGKRFFYPNPLASAGQHQRDEWFGCACCPGNITRFIASVPGYMYATEGEGEIYVNLYASGRAKVKLGSKTIKITQETRYPWDGKVKIVVDSDNKDKFTIKIRIPGWAQNQPVASDLYRYADKGDEKVSLKVNGKVVALNIEKGYVSIDKAWGKNDSIEIEFPMPVRRVLAHSEVKADVGRVAIERGPIVFCAEWPDNKDGHVHCLLLPDDEKLSTEFRKGMINGYDVQVVTGKAYAVSRAEQGGGLVKTREDLTLIPYYAWANRGRGDMAVWLAREERAVKLLPSPTIASKSKITASRGSGNPQCLADQYIPTSSNDHEGQFYHWWPRNNTTEWVEMKFEKATKVSSVQIYWFDDAPGGGCRVPESWQLFYKSGSEWKPVVNASGFGVEKDKFNKTTFDAVETEGLRIEVKLPATNSTGVHEWIVE